MKEKYNRDHFFASLEIDEDDLDRCLAEQPKLLFRVAEAVAIANARRDDIALRLKELKAAAKLRDLAARHNKKTGKGREKNQIIIASEIKKLERKYLDASTHAKKVRAMKEAYQRRSYALKDRVSLELEMLRNLGVERGAVSARNRIMIDRIKGR